jgi:hypothetical protein
VFLYAGNWQSETRGVKEHRMRIVSLSLISAVASCFVCISQAWAADLQSQTLMRHRHEAVVPATYEQCFTGWWRIFKHDEFRPRWETRCWSHRPGWTGRRRAGWYR